MQDSFQAVYSVLISSMPPEQVEYFNLQFALELDSTNTDKHQREFFAHNIAKLDGHLEWRKPSTRFVDPEAMMPESRFDELMDGMEQLGDKF